MKTSTPYNPREIQQKEKEMLQFLRENLKDGHNPQPSEQAVSNVIGYSRALTVKKSSKIGYIEQVLN